MIEDGRLHHLNKVWIDKERKCSKKTEVPLGFEKTISIFFIVLGGIAIGLVIIVMENYFGCMKLERPRDLGRMELNIIGNPGKMSKDNLCKCDIILQCLKRHQRRRSCWFHGLEFKSFSTANPLGFIFRVIKLRIWRFWILHFTKFDLFTITHSGNSEKEPPRNLNQLVSRNLSWQYYRNSKFQDVKRSCYVLVIRLCKLYRCITMDKMTRPITKFVDARSKIAVSNMNNNDSNLPKFF